MEMHSVFFVCHIEVAVRGDALSHAMNDYWVIDSRTKGKCKLPVKAAGMADLASHRCEKLLEAVAAR